MTGLQIRVATLEDIAGVLALDRATELLPHWAEADYVAALTRREVNLHRCLFVARSSHALAGFAVATTITAAEDVTAELESVAVAESARRTGVALALCAEAIAWAQSNAAKQIELEVRSQNSGAIRLYEKLGFVLAGRRRHYYKRPEDDALLMRRSI